MRPITITAINLSIFGILLNAPFLDAKPVAAPVAAPEPTVFIAPPEYHNQDLEERQAGCSPCSSTTIWLTTRTETIDGVVQTVAVGYVKKYGQCGGTGYTGGTACESGSTCVRMNDWYSQCL